MNGLDSLELVTTKFKPSDVELLQYLFFEKGISLEEFNKLPIPYILSMANCSSWAKEKQNPKKK